MATLILKAVLVAFLVVGDVEAVQLPGVGTGSKLIGYYDAAAQRALPVSKAPVKGLTHVVLTNAVRVDRSGSLVFMQKPHRRGTMKTSQELIQELAKSEAKVVISIRGFPDDEALDELAEADDSRQKFVAGIDSLLRDYGISGAEIQRHSEDLPGAKSSSGAVDEMDRFSLLCKELSSTLHKASTPKTLSLAVRPGKEELADGNVVRSYVDWLTVEAHGMSSPSDPHHSSVEDMQVALDEWTAKGVPKKQLVVGTPLFARPGSNSRDLHRPWSGLAQTLLQQDAPTQASRSNGIRLSNPYGRGPATQMFRGLDPLGDEFKESGQVWYVSGVNTTKMKVRKLLTQGYGGVALQDLNSDSSAETGLSLLDAASQARDEVAAAAFDKVRLQHRKGTKRAALASDSALLQVGTGLFKGPPTMTVSQVLDLDLESLDLSGYFTEDWAPRHHHDEL